MKPTLEEARNDLANIRDELNAMSQIKDRALFLSNRHDVDSRYYLSVADKTDSDIRRGEAVVKMILIRYPELS